MPDDAVDTRRFDLQRRFPVRSCSHRPIRRELRPARSFTPRERTLQLQHYSVCAFAHECFDHGCSVFRGP